MLRQLIQAKHRHELNYYDQQTDRAAYISVFYVQSTCNHCGFKGDELEHNYDIQFQHPHIELYICQANIKVHVNM